MTSSSPPRKIRKIAIILPTASTSKTNQRDIDRHVNQMMQKAAKAGQAKGIEYQIHITGNRSGNHTIRNRADAYNNLEVITHTPNFTAGGNKREHINEIRRTNGRIAATVDSLLVITGNRHSLTSMDREIVSGVLKRDKPIKYQKIQTHPTPQDEIPENAHFILPSSEYRVNLRNYKSLDHLLEDHCTHGPDDGQKPIYTGAPNKKTNNEGSPLANQFRNTADWQTKYRKWLWDQIKENNQEVIDALRQITRTTPLVCYCHNRKPCHTDIIRKAALWLAEQDAQRERSRDRSLDGKTNNKITRTRCTARTAKGGQCKRTTKNKTSLCYQHGETI